MRWLLAILSIMVLVSLTSGQINLGGKSSGIILTPPAVPDIDSNGTTIFTLVNVTEFWRTAEAGDVDNIIDLFPYLIIGGFNSTFNSTYDDALIFAYNQSDNNDLNLSGTNADQNLTLGSPTGTGLFDIFANVFRGSFNWITNQNSYYSFNRTTLINNETHYNKTIRFEGLRAGFNITFNSTYDSKPDVDTSSFVNCTNGETFLGNGTCASGSEFWYNFTGTTNTTNIAYTNVSIESFIGLNATGNISTSDRICLTPDCSSYIYNNGTHSIWR